MVLMVIYSALILISTRDSRFPSSAAVKYLNFHFPDPSGSSSMCHSYETNFSLLTPL